MPADYITLKNELTNRQWRAILQKAEKYDVSEGTSHKFAFGARRPEKKPAKDHYIIYWGRNGWNNGFYHAKLEVDKVGSNAHQLYATRSDDDRAKSLTKINNHLLPFIESALENIRDKDRMGD